MSTPTPCLENWPKNVESEKSVEAPAPEKVSPPPPPNDPLRICTTGRPYLQWCMKIYTFSSLYVWIDKSRKTQAHSRIKFQAISEMNFQHLET